MPEQFPSAEAYFKEIAVRARALASFMDNPEPGLGTWMLVAGDKIDKFYHFATHWPEIKP